MPWRRKHYQLIFNNNFFTHEFVVIGAQTVMSRAINIQTDSRTSPFLKPLLKPSSNKLFPPILCFPIKKKRKLWKSTWSASKLGRITYRTTNPLRWEFMVEATSHTAHRTRTVVVTVGVEQGSCGGVKSGLREKRYRQCTGICGGIKGRKLVCSFVASFA